MNIVSVDRVARPIAPEDLDHGAYVVVLRAVYQCVRMPSSDEAPDSPIRIRTVTMLPDDDGPVLFRVRAVCLPYALVMTPERAPRTLDTRRYTLGEVPASFGDTVFAQYRASGASGQGPPTE